MVTHRLLGIVSDGVLLTAAFLAAFFLRLGFEITPDYLEVLKKLILPVVLFKLVIFLISGLYDRLWRYSSLKDLNRIIIASSASSSALLVLLFLLEREIAMPRSVFVIDWLLTVILIGGARFFARILREGPLRNLSGRRGRRRVLVIGAGDSGETIVREMLRQHHLGYQPVGYLDDDPRKLGMQIHGVKVLGEMSRLPHILAESNVDQVIIAMPSASRSVKRDITFACEQAKVACKIVPTVYELLDGQVHLQQIRDVEIEDILGREAVEVNLDEIAAYLGGQCVLVTGAGGSIGSELCRQIAAMRPSKLVLLEIAESGLFEIWQELMQERAFDQVVPIVGDVRDQDLVDRVLARHRPSVVFHAAAYKHVPLMEKNAQAAFENNFYGTSVMVKAAVKAQVGKFVLISTDKAVGPSNVMGATKALAEAVVRCMSDNSETRGLIVRFGNVLGSSGSVVPIFKRQIARGGPVTVTDPGMRRYFMTIPEAVQLVIQAGALGRGGEVFVLKMGEPVRITDLAENMIRLSGFDPGKEIEISYIGRRAGEKLEEQLFAIGEAELPTSHPEIVMARPQSAEVDQWLSQLIFLETLAKQGDWPKARQYLGSFFPGLDAETDTSVVVPFPAAAAKSLD